MIDTLLYVFGPKLAEKFFADNRSTLTLDDVANAVLEVGEEGRKHKDAIARIEKQLQTITKSDAQQSKDLRDIYQELQGLAPHNLNPQLDEIRTWMRCHVEFENQHLRQLVRRQLYWNTVLACVAGLALLFSILSQIKW